MRILNLVLLMLISSSLFSQNIAEKEIKSEVKEVTVFINGAQVTRSKSVSLTKGKTIVKFVNLSPFVDAKSVQVKAKGALTVLSVNHQKNYLNKAQKSKKISDLEKQLKSVMDKINLENTHLSIINEELTFLKDNRSIGGKNEQINLVNLQQVSAFYGKKLTALKMKEIERKKTLKNLNDLRYDLQKQINTINNEKEYPSGEVLVKVDAKETNSFMFEISYLVGNAGWFPAYDVRTKDIDSPVQLIYRANVKQDTKVDWKNVKLSFSSAEPNVSGVAPKLKTYFLDYYTLPPTYNFKSNSVRGKLTDYEGNALSGAIVLVEGTTIGTATDSEGNYSITIPNNSSKLKYSYIGFNTKVLNVTGSVMNVSLRPDTQQFDEVVMYNYQDEAMAPNSKKEVARTLKGKTMGISSLKMPTVQSVNQTNVNFEIKMPYTILSDNKNYTVDMEYYNLPATYKYYCVPKINNDAFLIANIVGWEKYNLLEGEANIFFENTYVGKSILNVREQDDTLKISLGRDKKVLVKREKIKNFTNKQFIGTKKEETRAWKTIVKNNKNQNISITVLDQIPISTNNEIEVKVLDISDGKHNLTNGEIKWEFELTPNNKKEFDLKYSVKYPKNKNLIVE